MPKQLKGSKYIFKNLFYFLSIIKNLKIFHENHGNSVIQIKKMTDSFYRIYFNLQSAIFFIILK